jgi:outer membrane protein
MIPVSNSTQAPWKVYVAAALIALGAGGLAGRHAPPLSQAGAAGLLWAAPGIDAGVWQQQEAGIPEGAKPLKVGFIRSDLILQLHPRVPELRSALEAQLRQWQQQQSELEGRAQTLQNELRTGQLSPIARRNKEAELAQTMEDLNTFQTEVWTPGGRAEQKEQELMKPIVDAIDEAIKTIAEGEFYDLIFDGSAGGLLFGHRELDLTRAVLQRMGIEPPEPPPARWN